MNLKDELEFMRDLFRNKLPVAPENQKKAEEYFNSLEELISTKDAASIERERFPPDDPAICGTREYRYYSAHQFKELASRPQPITSGQELDVPENQQTKLPATENKSPDTQDVAHVPELPAFRRARTLQSCSICPDIQGQLDRRNSGELPNIQIDRDYRDV